METIAVYWEPKIRVYGLTTQLGLSLYTLVFPTSRLAYWAGVVESLEAKGRAFELVNLQGVSASTMQLSLLPIAGASDFRSLLEAGLENEEATSFSVADPVELIYLHGPHFQDRFGIAEAALAPLHRAGIPILAVGCAGTSVYLVIPENTANTAKTHLAETFVL
jgi:aspartokinase